MRILVASDDSAPARAALRVAQALPWPEGSMARGAVALGEVRWGGSQLGAEMARALHAGAERTRKALAARWPDAQVVELHESPADAICSEARRFRADLVALGWRGHGVAARLLAGSVSRRVAERAPCSVLIARDARTVGRAGTLRFAVGFDGSQTARRAARFLARLRVPAGGRVTLINVLEPVHTPPLLRVPAATRTLIAGYAREEAARRLRQAQRRLDPVAQRLRARGWDVFTACPAGAPLDELLREAQRAQAQVLVVGAPGTSGIARLLLGSVAAGAIDHSPVPVLLVR